MFVIKLQTETFWRVQHSACTAGWRTDRATRGKTGAPGDVVVTTRPTASTPASTGKWRRVPVPCVSTLSVRSDVLCKQLNVTTNVVLSLPQVSFLQKC